ncbi:MAG: hypothetical protein KA297_11875 [Kofleriaceae bacterium]|nr:hypothetical protein [Kofleriaceae bacterium]MBP6837949.1 hypothetical protein [Kofleriaceae bacterium]
MSRAAGVAALLLGLAGPTVARAEPPSPGLTWGLATVDVTMASVFTMAFATDWYQGSFAVTAGAIAAIVVPAGVAVAAEIGDWPATPPLLFHDAVWLGGTGYVLGALIDGRHDRHRLRRGPWSAGLAAAGALAGGALGWAARHDDDDAAAAMAAPAGGFLAGGLVLGTVLVVVGGVDGDRAPSQWATGAVVGGVLGASLATYLVTRDDPATPVARPAAGPPPVMFSFGGAF